MTSKENDKRLAILEDSEGDLSGNPDLIPQTPVSTDPSPTHASFVDDSLTENHDTTNRQQEVMESSAIIDQKEQLEDNPVSERETVSPLKLGNDDDDFGDFGTAQGDFPVGQGFSKNTVTTDELRLENLVAKQTLHPTVQEILHPLIQVAFPLQTCLPLTDPLEDNRSLENEQLGIPRGKIGLVKIQESVQPCFIQSTSSSVKSHSHQRLYIPSEEAIKESQSWIHLYQRLSTDTVFSESGTRFRWRRSAIRRAFLDSLNVDMAAIEGSKSKVDLVQTPLSATVNSTSAQLPGGQQLPVTVGISKTMDDREKDLMDARRLCETTEDDLRRKTPAELQEYIRLLHVYHQKMQEQANYWLDAKEQLIMDAETHNKVIASLVQYAQQQQQAPKGSSSMAQSTSKKKWNVK